MTEHKQQEYDYKTLLAHLQILFKEHGISAKDEVDGLRILTRLGSSDSIDIEDEVELLKLMVFSSMYRRLEAERRTQQAEHELTSTVIELTHWTENYQTVRGELESLPGGSERLEHLAHGNDCFRWGVRPAQ